MVPTNDILAVVSIFLHLAVPISAKTFLILLRTWVCTYVVTMNDADYDVIEPVALYELLREKDKESESV